MEENIMEKLINPMVKNMSAGNSVSGNYLITDASVRQSNAGSGSKYFRCTVKDSSGSILANLWNCGDINPDMYNGKIVSLFATIESYKGKPQLTIHEMKCIDSDLLNATEMNAIIPTAPIDVVEACSNIRQKLNTISNTTLRCITTHLFDKYEADIKRIPAAKTMHHAFVHGLLMHTLSVMAICSKIAQAYDITLGLAASNALINKDLLIAGAFCHDLAKNREFILDEYGLATDLSEENLLLGHLAMGIEYVNDAARACHIDPNAKEIIFLKHMILSHHGTPEKGACTLPKIPEAEILSYADDLDAKLEMYREKYQNMEGNSISDYHAMLSKRIIKK